jgi:hypothetical protein
MPRKRYGKTGIVPYKVNDLWYCAVCNEQKGKTKKDCEQHQGFCLRVKEAIIRDKKFGIIPNKENPKILDCEYCKHQTNKK